MMLELDQMVLHWYYRLDVGFLVLSVKTSKDLIQSVRETVVCGVQGCAAVFVASDGFYPLQHALGVFVVEVLLYTLLVSAFGLPDPSPQLLSLAKGQLVVISNTLSFIVL